MTNWGSVPIGAVLPFIFGTYAGATGASITLTGLAATDIEVYKNGSVTQRASDAGYTLLDTDGIDFDGTTGIHGFSIDTGDNTDAGFYTSGAFFNVVVSAVTIDGQTVNFVAGTFRCVTAEGVAGQPKVDVAAFGGTAATTSGGRPEVNTSHAAGTAWGSGAITAASIASDAITDAKVASDVTIASVTGAVGSVTGAVGSVTGNVGGNVTGSVGSVAANGIAATSIATGAITAAKFAASAIDAAALAADAVTEIQSGLATSAALATVDTVVDSILVDTAEIGAAGAGLTALATAANLATVAGYLDTEIAAIKAKTDSLTFTVANQVDANALAIAGSTAAATHLKDHAVTAVPVTFNSGGSTTTAVLVNVDGAAASSTNDVYNGRVLIFTGPAGLAYQATDITDYDGATLTATITAVTTAPGATATAIMV